MKKYIIVVCVLVMFCSVFSFGQYEYNSFLCDILISENITDSLCVLKKDSLFHTKKDTTELPLEFPDTPPTFPGGEMNYMRRKFRFPLETIESGMVSGRIVVSWRIGQFAWFSNHTMSLWVKLRGEFQMPLFGS